MYIKDVCYDGFTYLDDVRDVVWTDVAKSDIDEHAHHVPYLAVPVHHHGERVGFRAYM